MYDQTHDYTDTIQVLDSRQIAITAGRAPPPLLLPIKSSWIYPCLLYDQYYLQEENDTSEFQLLLEKDPQQEDFLQGRMLGNPYK